MAASKSGVTLDTVMISIESNAGQATGNIDSLAASLEKLKGAIKGGFNNINKLAAGLEKLKSAAAGLDGVSKNLSTITNIVTPLKSLSDIPNAKGLRNVVKSLEELPQVFNKLDTKTIENITKTSEKLSNALTPLASKMSSISSGYSSLSQMVNTYGKASNNSSNHTKNQANSMGFLKKTISGLPSLFKSITGGANAFGKMGVATFKKVNSKVKQLALSLLGTRTIFTATRKAISEIMSMDKELSDSVTNIWRALGAQLVPAVEFVINLFKQFVRVIYSVIKAITGIDLIARANAKATASWGKSAKDALGSLQKFDDLNVVDFGKGSGDDNKLIDLEEIDLTPIQKIMDWVIAMKNAIKEAFDTGEWYGVGSLLAKGINDAMDALNFDLYKEKIFGVIRDFGEFANGVIQGINFEKVGDTISRTFRLIMNSATEMLRQIDWAAVGNGITDFITGLDIPTMIKSIMVNLQALTIAIQDTFLNIDWALIAQELSDSVTNLLEGIDVILGTIKWDEIANSFNTFIENINYEDIANKLFSILGKVVTALATLISTLDWGGFAKTLSDNALLGFQKITELVQKIDWAKLGKDLMDALFDIIQNIDWDGLLLSMLTLLGELTKGIIDFLVGVVLSLFEKIKENATKKWNELVTKFEELTGVDLSELWTSIKETVSEGWEKVKEIITSIPKKVKEKFNEIKDNISNKIDEIKNKFTDTFDTIKTKWNNFWGGLWSGVKGIINRIIGGFESFVNSIIRGINKLLGGLNKFGDSDFLKTFGLDFEIKQIPEISIPRLETGTNQVPYDDMLAVLHKNEAVVPAKYNPAVGGGNSDEMIERLDRLIFLTENQEHNTIVKIGNKKLYQEQSKYNRKQYNKYGTLDIA